MNLNLNREELILLAMALEQHLLLVLESGTVNPVTLKSVNPLSFSIQISKIRVLITALANPL